MNYTRYKDQILVEQIGESGQKTLFNSRIVIIGMGALGSVIANNLTRAGIGEIKLVDRDIVELNNLQRQFLYDEEDVNQVLPKSIAARNKLAKINSEIEIESVVTDVTKDNIEGLINGYDLVLDGTDNFFTRFLINDVCFKLHIPWVFTGVLGTVGQSAIVIPGRTPCLRCILPEQDVDIRTCDTVGILGPTASILGSIASVSAIKVLLNRDIKNEMTFYDVWLNKSRSVKTNINSNCPLCRNHRFDYLKGWLSLKVNYCNDRNCVHIKAPFRNVIDLSTISASLKKSNNIRCNDYLLQFDYEEYKITLFKDGRAMIEGTTDINKAKSLYSKCVTY